MRVDLIFPLKMFYVASFLYVVGLIFYLFRFKRTSLVFFITGLIFNLISEISGRWLIWPFCNMFSEVFFLPLALSIIGIFLFLKRKTEGLWLYPFVVMWCVVAIFFSEGYYPPFTLMSKSIFAHLFHLFVFSAHSLLLGAFFIAFLSLILKKTEGSSEKMVIWGYAFLCVAGLFGMIWSYVGRGDVISWNHYFFHSIGVWLYYSAFLHLYLIKEWNQTKRVVALLIGSFFIIWLDLLPQIGGIHTPGLIDVKLYRIF